jgi:uncharacterized membrane protein
MILIAQLAAAEGSSALARLAEPWNALYSDSKVVSSAVVFLHLVPLLLAGGAALSADRATLRAARDSADERTRHLRELARAHGLVLGGLALSFVSGVLLFLADVDEYLGSPIFWVKLAFVGLLLVNGFMMTRTERSLASGGDETTLWTRLRTISLLSQFLWISTTLVGVVLMSYA